MTNSFSISQNISEDHEKHAHFKKEHKFDVVQTLKEVSDILFPNCLFLIALFLQLTINLMFIGHTYDEETRKDALNAVGLSHLYINCTLLSVVLGILSGFDTVGSNAFGAKKYYLFGVYYHRAQMIGGVVAFISLIFQYLFAVRIIGWFGLDDKVMEFISEYIYIYMLFVIFDGQAALNFRYLNIIGKSKINMIIVAVTFLLHPLWCYIFINYFGLEIRGAAISLLISQMLNAAGGFLYIFIHNPVPESVFFYTEDSFKGWLEYLKIAIPSAFLLCFDFWAYEILALISIWIGKLQYTVHILLANLNSTIFTICIAFSISATIMLGNAVTNHGKDYLKYLIKIMIAYGLVFISIICFILFSYRKTILYVFIDDEEVIQLGQTVIPLMCIYNILDNFQFVCNGIFRALGKQLIASYTSFFNLYVTQTVLAIIFGKVLGGGVFGVWLGCTIGSLCNDVAYLIILSHFDLDVIKEEVMERINNDNHLLKEVDNDEYHLIQTDKKE